MDEGEVCLVILSQALSYPCGTPGCNLRKTPLNVARGYITVVRKALSVPPQAMELPPRGVRADLEPRT